MASRRHERGAATGRLTPGRSPRNRHVGTGQAPSRSPLTKAGSSALPPLLRCLLFLVLLLASVLEHLTAGLLALATLRSAHLHVLVVGKCLTRLAAASTGLGAGLANQVGERPLA